MSDRTPNEHDPVAAAFDRLVDRRERTTDVGAAYQRITAEAGPRWRRFAVPMALGAAAATAAIVLIVMAATGDDSTKVETPPLATDPTTPDTPPPSVSAPAQDTIPPRMTPTTGENVQAAIAAHLAAQGFEYDGDCDDLAPADPRFCSRRLPDEPGGGEIYAVVGTDTDDRRNDLFVLVHDAGATVVNERPPDSRIVQRKTDDDPPRAVEFVVGAGTTTVLDEAALRSDPVAVPALGDLYVGVDRSANPNASAECDRALLRVDGRTGEVTEIADGVRPSLSSSARYLAYLSTIDEGFAPSAEHPCTGNTRLVIRDLLDGSEHPVEYPGLEEVGGGSLDVARWAPGANRLAIRDHGFDSGRNSIVEVASDGTATRIELDREVPELDGLLSNEFVAWESADVLRLRFYSFEEVPDLYARYSADGSFLSLYDPNADQPGPALDLASLSLEDWSTAIAATPEIEVLSESGGSFLPGAGPEVELGNAYGYVQLDSVFFEDLDGDGSAEAIMPLTTGGSGADAGVLVFAASSDGPRLVGPMSFYEQLPGADLIVDEMSDGLFGIAQSYRPEWAPHAVSTASRSWTYTMADGELSLAGDSGEVPMQQGFFELDEFLRRAIEGETDDLDGFLTEDVDLFTDTGERLPEALEMFANWQSVDITNEGIEAGRQLFRLEITLDSGERLDTPVGGSLECGYDASVHHCRFSSLSITMGG